MKKKLVTFEILLLMFLVACGGNSQTADIEKIDSPTIFLYGEEHSVKEIMEKELELWGQYYVSGMRHLFLEIPYYSAEFLNIWMQEDNDNILDEFYEDLKGTLVYNELTKRFYKTIKEKYPETIFHGTDVGHQYNTTGTRYLNYLKENNIQDKRVERTKEIIKQGQIYYKNRDNSYRENKMVKNFIREYNLIADEKIMGIYGNFHTKKNGRVDESTPTMVNNLIIKYGEEAIKIEDLTYLVPEKKVVRTDAITISGKKFKAFYYGIENLRGFKDFESREFWKLEDAYDYIKDFQFINDILPYDNYPVNVKKGDVFCVRVIKRNKESLTLFYRASGGEFASKELTQGFFVNDYQIKENM